MPLLPSSLTMPSATGLYSRRCMPLNIFYHRPQASTTSMPHLFKTCATLRVCGHSSGPPCLSFISRPYAVPLRVRRETLCRGVNLSLLAWVALPTPRYEWTSPPTFVKIPLDLKSRRRGRTSRPLMCLWLCGTSAGSSSESGGVVSRENMHTCAVGQPSRLPNSLWLERVRSATVGGVPSHGPRPPASRRAS
ncbi:unnamed protein product [Somion occarium]|uniref:Uncharacterized protein n=1 Tax=Somion occarium TaxID=3059160 RepID=A0ABP1CQX1_9APHY